MPKLTSLRGLTPRARLDVLLEESGIDRREEFHLQNAHPPIELADQWIENAVGYFSLPLGVAEHFVIDGIARRIPIAIEETSIIAALSSAAKWVGQHGSIVTESVGAEAIGQIQFPIVQDGERALTIVREREAELVALANSHIPGLVRRGGGFRSVAARILDRPEPVGSRMLIVHLLCDTRDAMGANAINQACELVSETLSGWLEEPVGMRILSNLTDQRRAKATIELHNVDDSLAARIEEASRFAELDPYRAATHNKGILNGIDGLLIATGNDWRAVEAGAHAYACRSGRYAPLSIWRRTGNGSLRGVLDLPMAVGTVGGVTRNHPAAALALRWIGVTHAPELGRIAAAVGLVQNLAALRALCSVGIVAGHMRLHLGNVVLASTATPVERPQLRVLLEKRFAESRRVSATDAEDLLRTLRENRGDPVPTNF